VFTHRALNDLVRRAQLGGALTMMICAPIWGASRTATAASRWSWRAMGCGFVLATLSSFAQHPWHILILRLLEGATIGTVSASGRLRRQLCPEGTLGFSLGLMQMAVFSGASIGPFVGGYLSDLLGYRHTLWVSGALLASAGSSRSFFAHEDFKPQTFTGTKRPSFLTTTRAT